MQRFSDACFIVGLSVKNYRSSVTMSNTYDVIVLGTGSMGSSACYYLADHGLKVLGLEQSTIVHEQGSHHGQSRIIRKAYFEHPDYVPLLKRAYELWNNLSVNSGEQLYTETGLLYAGNPDSALMKGIHDSASIHDISIQSQTAVQNRDVYPVFNFPDSFEVIKEPSAGFLYPEKCIRIYVQQAIEKGASIMTNTKVLGWKSSESHVEVTTSAGKFYTDKLVITAGPWMSQVLPGLDKHLKVTRQTVFWADMKNPEIFSPDRFPCWLAEHPETGEYFYGFPFLPVEKYGQPYGLKFAQHNPGEVVNPETVNRDVSRAECDHISKIIDSFFPGYFKSVLQTKVCLYTYSPDEHFIIDKLPEDPRVVFAGGFSGHGFKFSSVIGEILTDLSVNGYSEMPIDFLSAGRLR